MYDLKIDFTSFVFWQANFKIRNLLPLSFKKKDKKILSFPNMVTYPFFKENRKCYSL